MECENFTVITNEKEADKYAYTALHTLNVSAFLPIVLVIGVVSNCSFLFVVYRVKFMHTITGCYLANLSLADLTFLLAAIVPKLVNFISTPIYPDDSPIGLGGCILAYVTSNIAYFASLLFITYVSWERFRAVCRPHQKAAKWKQITLLIAVTWIFCFGFSLTFIPAFAKYEQKCIIWPPNDTYVSWPRIQSMCISTSSLADSYAGAAQTTPFFVCFIVNIILYSYIVKGMRDSIKRLGGNSRSLEQMRAERERLSHQITRMLLINSILFFVLLSPFEFLSLTRSIRVALDKPSFTIPAHDAIIFTYVFRILAYSNSIINPVIYTAFSRKFRQAFIIAFCGHLRQSKEEYDGTVETIRLSASDKSSIRITHK